MDYDAVTMRSRYAKRTHIVRESCMCFPLTCVGSFFSENHDEAVSDFLLNTLEEMTI